MLVRTDAVVRFACLAAITCPILAFAQAATAPGATRGPDAVLVPGTVPPGMVATAPATRPTTLPSTAPATRPAPAAAADLPPVTQAFVATITDAKVNVRSGPGTAYYEIGQLTKGDLVYVVGTSKDWYKILPPNGTFCLIAKEYVELDAGGTTGAVKGDYINVRAGSAIYKNRDPSAVLAVVRKGTRVRVIGATDQYYQIAPPDATYVYISSQYIKAAAGTDYKVADLKLPAGVAGPGVTTVVEPTTPVVAIGGGGATIDITVPGGTAPGGETATVVPTPGPVGVTPTIEPIVPAVVFSAEAKARFNDANARYLEESKKPLTQQNVAGFVKEFQDIVATPNVSPTVAQSAQANLKVLERTASLQRLMREQAAATELANKQTDALRQQYEASQKLIESSRQAAPFINEGVLKSSTVVTGKYALVNPETGRTVAYIDPAGSSIDVALFMNHYIGVRGDKKTMDGSEIEVITVRDATLMPQPGSKQ